MPFSGGMRMGCGFIDEAFWIAMQIMCEKQKKEYIDPSEVTALELEHGERTSLGILSIFRISGTSPLSWQILKIWMNSRHCPN